MKKLLIITNLKSFELKNELFEASKIKNCSVITIPVETNLQALNISPVFKAEIISEERFLKVIEKISYPLFKEIKEVLEIYA